MEEPKSESTAPPTVTNSKKKREDKMRYRDLKALDNVLKSINALPESERIEALLAKYTELYNEHRNLQLIHVATKKQSDMLQKEKDHLQNEQSKCLLARSRMESLCRELQRQNKLIKVSFVQSGNQSGRACLLTL